MKADINNSLRTCRFLPYFVLIWKLCPRISFGVKVRPLLFEICVLILNWEIHLVEAVVKLEGKLIVTSHTSQFSSSISTYLFAYKIPLRPSFRTEET